MQQGECSDFVILRKRENWGHKNKKGYTIFSRIHFYLITTSHAFQLLLQLVMVRCLGSSRWNLNGTIMWRFGEGFSTGKTYPSALPPVVFPTPAGQIMRSHEKDRMQPSSRSLGLWSAPCQLQVSSLGIWLLSWRKMTLILFEETLRADAAGPASPPTGLPFPTLPSHLRCELRFLSALWSTLN